MPANKYLHHKHRNTKSKNKTIDMLCMYFAVLMPMTTLPQIFKLYATKDGSDLSLLMWVLYSIGVIPFLLYGIIHKEKQLVILNVLWLLMQAIIIVGIIMYG